MSNEPWTKRLLRYALIAGGGSALISAVVGIISAYQLIEPSDEQALGITPRDFAIMYVVMAAFGLVMLFFGFRLKAKK